LSRASTSCFRAAKEDVDGRVKPGHDDYGCEDGPDQPRHESAANAGFHPAMRPDLIFAMVLAAVSAILAVAGFFIMEWSPIVIGLLIGVMLAADGYFVLGFVRQTKEGPAGQRNQSKKTP